MGSDSEEVCRDNGVLWGLLYCPLRGLWGGYWGFCGFLRVIVVCCRLFGFIRGLKLLFRTLIDIIWQCKNTKFIDKSSDSRNVFSDYWVMNRGVKFVDTN